MDDRALVDAMRSGDPRGLEGAYRRYADRLFGYCRSLLRDPEGAGDVVHDTFLIASRRVADLREPDRLPAWLFTIARRECLRAQRSRRRQASLDEADEPADAVTDPGRRLQQDQLRELMGAAASGLNPPDREVIDLSLRHGLGAQDIAGVLGVSASHAHARISRARGQLHRALAAVLLLRAGDDCVELARLRQGWAGRLDPLLRKRVSRHADGCPQCRDRQRALLNPAELLPAYAALPLAAAPAAIWARLAHSASAVSGSSAVSESSAASPASAVAPASAASGSSVASGSSAASPASAAADESGSGPAQGQSHGKIALLAATVLVLGSIGIGVALAKPGSPTLPLTAATSPESPAAAPPAAGPGGLATPPPAGPTTPLAGSTPPLAGSASVSTVTTPAGTPRPPSRQPSRTPDQLVVSFTVTATGYPVCLSSPVYRIHVTVTANQPIVRVLLYWEAPTKASTALDRVSPTTASGASAPLGSVAATWWVTATAKDGRVASTPVRTLVNPCH